MCEHCYKSLLKFFVDISIISEVKRFIQNSNIVLSNFCINGNLASFCLVTPDFSLKDRGND